MKKLTLALGFGIVLALAGCSARQQTSLQTQPEQLEEQQQVDQTDTEDMMTKTEMENDTTLQVPSLQKTDDTKSIESDLNSTVVSDESFQ